MTIVEFVTTAIRTDSQPANSSSSAYLLLAIVIIVVILVVWVLIRSNGRSSRR